MIDAEWDKDSTTDHKTARRYSCAPHSEFRRPQLRKVSHARDVGLELLPTCRCEAVTLLISGGVVQFHRLNPAILHKASDRSEQSPRAHPDTSITQRFNVSKQSVPVPRPIGETDQYQQNRFRQRLGFNVLSPRDMSHDDMYKVTRDICQA